MADPAGAEVYYGRPRVASGGALDLAANADCELNRPRDGRSNEHITWALGPPPPGIYEVRVSHWKSCGAHATSYVVSIYNHGRTSTFSGSFTGPGDDDDGRVIGRVITLFQVGDDPAPERAPRLSSSYRGSGDQVFVLNNPNGEVLDDTLYTLDLGNALAEVYVVGTAGNYHVDPEIERLDLREAVAKGRRAAVLQDPDHPATRRSAERLIFFMDSALFAIPEGLTWEVTDYRPSQVIGILAHEFQHMIHFYQKRVLRGVASPTWLNEMASEVAVDLIAEQMMLNGPRAVAYDDPTAGSPDIRTGRLPIYNLFNDVPVTAWYSKIANYAINYALGAYLARTYGGAELFSEIVQRDESGIDAIDAALQALGHDVSFAEVLADWAVATLLSDNTAAPAPYRYNPGTWTTSHVGGEEFRLGSINLYNYRYDPPDPVPDCIGPQLQGRSAQDGPYLHSLQSLSERTQPPHSNAFATLGRNTGTVRLVVSAESKNRITLVVKE